MTRFYLRMQNRKVFSLLAGLLLVGAARFELLANEQVDFNRDVRPILSNHCFQCHGPDEQHREAELRLDIEASAKADRDGSFVVKPGNSDDSELVARILSEDSDELMPPPEIGKPLSKQQIETLRRWVDQGAQWKQHWAFERPVKSAVPSSRRSESSSQSESSHWIDRFIDANLQKHSLQAGSRADEITLLRRLYFDLTGLPPEPQQVRAFVHSSDPDKYQQTIDRLLASPGFGERMAIYWLDLVRFADTVGYHGDQDHAITPYRDYVIDAFNDNKPFDQFTREQLAGDLHSNATTEQKIATGYNRLLQTSHEGGVQPKEYLSIYSADRVRNVSAVWLGGTLGCAQCHDHKYDPYTAADFYSMAAFFADIDEAKHFKVGSNDLPTKRPPEIDVLKRAERVKLARLQQDLTNAKDEASKKRIAEAIRHLESKRRRLMVTVAMPESRPIRILPRGDWLDDSGPLVQPAVPVFLGKLANQESRPTRLDLANWLTDRDQAGLLTARVFANRVWYLYFGRGLSKSLDDFGGQGFPPDHPELLDNLAWRFVESGWDIKHLVREIVSSETYQRSSLPTAEHRQKDPENKWFARQNRYRLPAEMIRDHALAVGQLLHREIGGSSAKPYQPAGYYRHLNFPKRKYAADQSSRQYRRGVYVHWQRQFLHPMLKAFDAPSREECSAERPRSNTPLAALTLLNDPSFMSAARGLAERVLETTQDDKQRIELAFQLATSRVPDEFDVKVLSELRDASLQEFQKNHSAVTSLLQRESVDENQQTSDVELASWISVARAILNLSEATTRY